MLRKVLIINIIVILLINCNFYVLADDKIENVNINETEEIIETVAVASETPKINSRYAVVIDKNSKAILYGKNELTKTKMASTTKIMTAIIVIENTNLNEIVEISSKAAGTGGSRLKIKKGDKVSVKDLLYGLMLRSGNDAAVALAEYVGGSINGFAELMNKKAMKLGLNNTHFETPHGLDSDEHYTTPYELAILTDYALKNKTFTKIVGTKSCTITINGIPRTIGNTNELLGYLNGVYGVKTGFTNGAGRCLVTAIKRGDMDIICVVLGADTKKIRTTDSVKLIEYVFSNFKNIDISELIEKEFENWKQINEGRINIEKGIKKGIKIKLSEYHIKNYPIENGTEDKIDIKMECDMQLKAPVEENRKIGKLIVLYNNQPISEIDIITNETIRKKGISDYVLEILKNYGNYLEKTINVGGVPLSTQFTQGKNKTKKESVGVALQGDPLFEDNTKINTDLKNYK